MADNYLSSNQDVDDRFQTLMNNVNAARAVSQVVEGTIGPRGLDVMLVDRFGDVVISNDGVTILKLMEASHPAARMIINTVKAQQAEVGDGTTTTAIIAGALIAEGASQVLKGVPVTRVIEGMSLGISRAVALAEERSRQVDSLEDPFLYNAACVAARGHHELAEVVIEGARLLGSERLLEPEFKFADSVIAREMAAHQVFNGVILNREPMNREMPRAIEKAVILVIDDALAPEEVEREAIKTESGFQYYLKARDAYEENLHKISNLGINLVVVDRNIDATAEEFFTGQGITAVQRVSAREIERLCRHTGARKIKRSSLSRGRDFLRECLGKAEKVRLDEKSRSIYVTDGAGQNWATIMVGASTEEIVDERERMARDAASAVQATLKGGWVPGAGSLEIWICNHLEDLAKEQQGLASFGVLCVKEALIKPFLCMAANAGFNPLEKLGAVIAAQRKSGVDSISFHGESDRLVDAVEEGIIDPTHVKKHAFLAAGEVAAAILKIHMVIKMKADDQDVKSYTQG